MSQHDYIIDDQDGLSFLSDLNNMAAAVVTNNSGPTAPLVLYGNMLWADTSANKLKKRNSANTIWVEIGNLDEAGYGSLPITGGTVTGPISMTGAPFVEVEGASVTAASTTDIWTADGNTRHITGNTGITSLGIAPQAGAWMKVIFDGTPTLTQSGNLNLNAGGSNITIEAGDIAFVYADTTTQLDVFVIRKSGRALASLPVITSVNRKNLFIKNDVTNPNTKINITADELIFSNSSGSSKILLNTVSFDIDITLSGAGGLDTGSEANDTWYYIHAYTDGTTTSGVLSLSATAPTLPSGFTMTNFLGAVRNNGSGNLYKFYQQDNRVFIPNYQVSNTLPGTSFASIALGDYVPPIARNATFNAEIRGGANLVSAIDFSPDNTLIYNGFNYTTGGQTSYTLGHSMKLPILVSQTMYYKRTGDALTTFLLRVSDWEF